MLKLDEAKRVLHGAGLSRLDKTLVLLAITPANPLPIKDLRKRCASAGVPKLAKSNLSDVLAEARGAAARTGSADRILAGALPGTAMKKNQKIALAAQLRQCSGLARAGSAVRELLARRGWLAWLTHPACWPAI